MLTNDPQGEISNDHFELNRVPWVCHLVLVFTIGRKFNFTVEYKIICASADVSRVLAFFNARLDSKKKLEYTTCLKKLQTVSSFVFCCRSGLSF